MAGPDHYLGIFEGHFDPAVALVRRGEVIAYAEEERFIRQKHANRVYPRRALKYCLDTAGIGPGDIAAIGLNWDIDGYTNGRMAAFFEDMQRDWPLDPATKGWQRSMLNGFNRETAGTETYMKDPRRKTLGKPFDEWDAGGLLRLAWEAWSFMSRQALREADKGLAQELWKMASAEWCGRS